MKITRRLAVSLFLFFSLCLAIELQAESLRLVSSDWAPYTGPKLKNGGLVVEVVQTALKKAGYDSHVTFEPWARALRNTYAGKYDGIVGVWPTKERNEYISMSDEYYRNRLVLVGSKDKSIRFESLTDLKGLKIGTVRDYDYTPEFNDADYFYKLPVARDEQNLIKLLYGRIDVAIFDENIAKHYLNSEPYSQNGRLKIIHPAFFEGSLRFGMSNKYTKRANVLQEFNKVLLLMKNDGTYKEILSIHGFE